MGATGLAPLLIVLVGAAAYANSFSGVLLFDDAAHILENDRIRDLWSLPSVLGGRRPVVDLSLAVNYALGGFSPAGYHVVNLGVHLAAALTLYGVVRRGLLCDTLRPALGRAAPWLALITSALWVVHPLQTQSVTYLIQRAESLMGLFYLLTIYTVLRGASSPRPARWYVLAVLCCAMGMGSKAVMVTAPVMALLLDRACLAGSLAGALRRRWALYAGLAATWAILWLCGVFQGVLNPSRPVGTVGFSYKGITPLEYALTQSGVLVHYARLSIWPHPLCLDHAWPVARGIARTILPAAIVAVLMAGFIWALWRRPRAGLIGAWFFLILAPTSSLVPIKDPLFEHRMYLPLAAILAGLVLGMHNVLVRSAAALSLSTGQRRAVAWLLAVASIVALGCATLQRNSLYSSDVAMWRDVASRRPHNARAFEQLGTALVARGRLPEAIDPYRRAVTINPDFTSAHTNLGNALTQTGQFEEAIRHYDRVRGLDPDHVEARLNRGHALEMLGRIPESIEAYREATQVNPRRADTQALARAYYNLGSALGRQGDLDAAVTHYRKALDLRPDYEKAHYSLGWVLEHQGHLDEAVAQYRAILDVNPDHEAARRALENARNRMPTGRD